MKYENRLPDDGINVTRHNPFLHFLKLLTAAIILVVLAVFILNFLGAKASVYIPFKYEVSLMDRVNMKFGSDQSEGVDDYLSQLAKSLEPHLPVPEGMSFSVHYDDDSEFNAYATLAGNVVFYRGLLQELPNENALAMVVAHEMAHVIHRHPAASIGGGLSSAIGLMLLGSAGGGDLATDILVRTGSLTQMAFSRDMEAEADRTAIAALASYYGHVNGADELFRVLAGGPTLSGGESPNDTDVVRETLEKLESVLATVERYSSTHPLDDSRIGAIEEAAIVNDWPRSGELTALPQNFALWLSAACEGDSAGQNSFGQEQAC